MPDWNQFRDDFPSTRKYAYLDNAAIAPIPKPVYNEVLHVCEEFLNHGGTLWDKWIMKVEQTRELYAKFIGADDSEEIAFTHSTSEGMNIISHMLSDKGTVISNELEYPSSNLPWLNKTNNIKFVKATDGNKILIDDLVKAIDQDNKIKTLVTSHVEYSTGFRQDLKELGKVTKQKGIYFVVNPTQSLGALYFSVNDFGIDFMASNGHKWTLSSLGVGAMYIRRKYLKDLEKFKPSFFSQSGQKKRENFHDNMNLNISTTAARFELGTPHVQNIVALNAALRYITKIGIRNIEKRIMYLTDYLIDNLQKLKIEILSPVEQKKYRSGIVTFIPRKKKPAQIVDQLETRSKVVVSARGKGIRISPHFYNIEQDIDRLILGLRTILRSA